MTSAEPTPYGYWPSPISAEDVARAGTSYDAVQMAGGHVYWVEGRPDADMLVRWSADEGATDVLPPGTSAASYVHEYGGGAYLATEEGVWFCRAEDQRICRVTPSGIEPVTPLPEHGEHRYADFRLTPAGLLISVRERHEGGQVVNELVAVPADGSAPPRIIAEGWDFYSYPRPNPDGTRLAWTTWRPPQMPWDGTWLWVADLRPDGRLGEPELVAGGPEESIFQPEWSPDGTLHFVSDRTGWWSLYAHRDGRAELLVQVEGEELGTAQWELGYATYAFLGTDQIAVLLQQGPRHRLAIWHSATREIGPVDLPYTSMKPYLASDRGGLALIGSAPTRAPTVALIELETGSRAELSQAQTVAEPAYLSVPEAIRFPTRDGSHAYALFYPPCNTDAKVVGGLPPLIVRPHPGPTANFPLRLDPHVQLFTSRGFAVLDVDYRGSTGYGRAYRNALRGRWGVVDVSDCIDAATHLGGDRADKARCAIRGASAGGYTALRAAATTTFFAAAVAYSAIVDAGRWRHHAPKFQAHHADLLVGSASDRVDGEPLVLVQKNAVTRPLLLIHGERDTVTPIACARKLVAALGSTTTLLVLPHEAHGIRHPAAVRQSLEAELEYYQRFCCPSTGPDSACRHTSLTNVSGDHS